MLGQIIYWQRRMRRRRFLGTLGMGTTAALLAAACGGSQLVDSGARDTAPSPVGASPVAQQGPAGGRAIRGGNLTAVMIGDPENLDPARAQFIYSKIVLNLTADTLFEIGKDGNVVGRVVEKNEIPQENVHLWSLRRGIRFPDGTDLNAEVVRFNLERHLNDRKSVGRQDVSSIDSIETPDPYTVKVTLKASLAPFPNKLTIAGGSGAGVVLSPTAVQKLGETLQRDLTGATSGPFNFAEWKKDTQIVLNRHDGYWKKDGDGSALPYLDSVTLKPFPNENVRLTNVKTGEADVMIGNPPYKDVADLKSDPDLAVQEIAGLGWSCIVLNTVGEPFNNPALRRAVSSAIDREQLRRTVYFGLGTAIDTPVPDTIPWATEKTNNPYITRDLAKAKRELATAGKPNGFKFTFQINGASPESVQAAELIKDELKGGDRHGHPTP